MVFSVSRLKLVEKIIAGEVLSETDFDYALGEFGQELKHLLFLNAGANPSPQYALRAMC